MGKSKSFISLAAILFLCILVYASSLYHPFSNLDDQVQVTENPDIRELGWANIEKIFSSTYVGMYQPLTTLVNAVIYSFSQLNPFAYHLFALILHLLNSILVFVLLRKFLQDPAVSLLLTGIFCLHPMQVESVAWVSASSSLLFGFFYLLALWNYLRFREEENQMKYLFLSLLFFLLSCLSKGTAVSLPVVLIAYDWYRQKRFSWSILPNKIPFLLLSVVFGLIAISSREDAGHLSDLSQSFSLLDRVFLVGHNLLFYPFKLLLPLKLSAFYPYPSMENGSLPFIYYLSMPIIGTLLFLLFRNASKNPLLLFAAAFYIFSIALMLQLIPVGNQLTTDRYIYLPMFGLLLMLGIALNKLKKFWIFASYSLLVLFALMSYQRSKIWESDVYLWKDVLSNYPNVAQAWNNLGNLYLEENKIQLALQHYNKALELQSQYADAYSNRGVIYSGMGRNDLAMRDFRKALQLRAHADAYFNLANELVKQKDFQQGIENFNRSIELKASPDAYANRAFAKLNLGRDASAMHDLNAAIQLDPNFADAYYLKAMYQLQKANGSEGCMNLKKAAELGHVNAMQAVKKFCG